MTSEGRPASAPKHPRPADKPSRRRGRWEAAHCAPPDDAPARRYMARALYYEISLPHGPACGTPTAPSTNEPLDGYPPQARVAPPAPARPKETAPEIGCARNRLRPK